MGRACGSLRRHGLAACREWIVSGGAWGYIWVSALFGIVNAFIGTILRILTFPLTLLTLGLFSVIVNALLLEITDGLSGHLTIDEFWWTAIWAAIILSLASMILDWIVRSVLAPAACPLAGSASVLRLPCVPHCAGA